MENFDVFISFKGTDVDTGEDTYSRFEASKLKNRLEKLGLKVFMSDATLKECETANFPSEIDTALDNSKFFILVYDKLENFKSDKHYWVYHEWERFNSLYRSGKKEKNPIYIMSCMGADLSNIPSEFEGINLVSIDVIVEQLKKRFNLFENDNKKDKYIHSNYTVDEEEERRLVVQARTEAKWDIDYFKEKINNISKTYNILDVGCADGMNTRLVFGCLKDNNYNYNLIGTDFKKDLIEKFNKKAYEHMHGEVIDYSNENWLNTMEEIMRKYNIDKFDYVYCALSLHHFFDRGESFIKHIRKYIREEGTIYIRSTDDRLKLAFPDESNDVLMKILEKYDALAGTSDRYHARKLYRYLKMNKYDHIKVDHHFIDTIGKSEEQREFLFDSAFGFRQASFKHHYDEIDKSNPVTAKKAEDEYEEINKLFEKMNTIVTSSSHYYAYGISIATAVRPSDFIEEN